jgi:hypothetical protein
MLAEFTETPSATRYRSSVDQQWLQPCECRLAGPRARVLSRSSSRAISCSGRETNEFSNTSLEEGGARRVVVGMVLFGEQMALARVPEDGR